jgi:hypothetical protein
VGSAHDNGDAVVKAGRKRRTEEPLPEARVKRERTNTNSNTLVLISRRLFSLGDDESGSLHPASVFYDDSEPTIVYQVSSRHLVSASPEFHSELTGPSGNSFKAADGLYYSTTFKWDPEALSIPLNIVHLRHRQVAKQLTVEMFANHYIGWGAFDLISSVWINDVRRNWQLRLTYDRDLMLWMLHVRNMGIDILEHILRKSHLCNSVQSPNSSFRCTRGSALSMH